MSRKVHEHFVTTARGISLPLHDAIAQVGQLTLPARGRRSLAHFLARAVAGQQLSTSAARSIWARVEATVQSRGSSIPEFFCARNARALRKCGLSQAKVRALIAIREAHERGVLSVRRLARLNHAQRSERLQEIWGIGQWTADMVSIFYFNDPDVWPEGDAGVYRALELIVGKRSKRTVRKLAGAFAPYRSFLALYMWRTLDVPKKVVKKRASAQPL